MNSFKEKNGWEKHRFIVVAPGHFHAALILKRPGYEGVSSDVAVYAPVNSDFIDYMAMVIPFNTRKENPASWNYYMRVGPDFLEKAIKEKFGDVAIFAGRNDSKIDKVEAFVDAGYNVLVDKPWIIEHEKLPVFEKILNTAEEKGLIAYDIMTERYEITSILQKLLAAEESVFGEIIPGTPEDPAVVKTSVHHLSKIVAGNQLKRPWWYFDTEIQGEGIADVTTHLVDLTFMMLFPERAIDYKKDIKLISAKRWHTTVQPHQYEKVTGLSEFPRQFKLDTEGNLQCYCNGQFTFLLDNIHISVEAIWNYEAPKGGGDTHYSIIKGTKSHLIILQGKEQNFRPELYVKPAPGTNPDNIRNALESLIKKILSKYPGLELAKDEEKYWLKIPDHYYVGHEAHFGQVVERFLKYLNGEPMPAWEKSNMLAKYYITTAALKLARENNFK